MDYRYTTDELQYRTMTTEELRERYLLEQLFEPGELTLTYLETERAIVGSAVPVDSTLELGALEGMAAAHFCERRELGALNIGGPGHVQVDGETHSLEHLDCLYIGRGAREIAFSSADRATPARFYLLSYPAHRDYPTAIARRAELEATRLGSAEEANIRTIHKCIHPDGIPSCQLVMGFTTLQKGSVWNTMPPHTHERRTEVYVYFDLAAGFVVHLMGKPEATRNLIVRDGQAVISPMWSIHTGAGTQAYSFCWGMGGENQEFADMDGIAMDRLR